MKLATFIADGREQFGVVMTHPHTREEWVFEPERTQARLLEYASRGTSAYFVTKPVFWQVGDAPRDMMGFLATGEAGMAVMRRFHDFMLTFLAGADTFILLGAGHRLADVKLRAPIPRPNLILGLVQNSPTVWRHTPERYHLNLFPQGHQRPQATVIDPDDPIILPYAERINGGWNPELAVIIGAGGRDIPVSEAMRHVAGYTIVSDVTIDYFRQAYYDQPKPLDWFEDATTSWGDKKSDARLPMGPYLVTPDEVGNPYDLLIYTRQSGYLRDRSHTGAMHLGIERVISWLSSFRTLLPGDIIHMGTMGYDGSPFQFDPVTGDTIESEIEKLGVLRNPVIYTPSPETAPEISAPAVRELVGTPQERITEWRVENTRHFWTALANDADAETRDGLLRRPYPRFLAAPATALAASGARVHIPKRGGNLTFGAELACVIGRVSSRLSVAEAEAAILGYLPLAVLRDSSFADAILEPASLQERHLPSVYARWPDGFNIAGAPAAIPADSWRGRDVHIALSGHERITANTDDYLRSAAELIAHITRYITLFPGDVVTLGRLGDLIHLPHDGIRAGLAGHAEIDGLGRADFVLGG